MIQFTYSWDFTMPSRCTESELFIVTVWTLILMLKLWILFAGAIWQRNRKQFVVNGMLWKRFIRDFPPDLSRSWISTMVWELNYHEKKTTRMLQSKRSIPGHFPETSNDILSFFSTSQTTFSFPLMMPLNNKVVYPD